MPKQNFSIFLKTTKSLKKHSPEILMGIGIAGMITATVAAVRVTPKAIRQIDQREIQENKRLTKFEIVKTTWKYYIPAAVTGTLSIACLIGASSEHLHRNAALTTACTISETALKEYREKAAEIVGPKKEEAIRNAIAKDHVEKTSVGKSEIVVTGKGDTLCFDPFTGRYFQSNIEKIRKAENDLNRRLRDEMTITLNEFYYELGLSSIAPPVGERLGWTIDGNSGYIDMDFSSQLTEDGTPCLVVGHHKPPTYIF